MGLGNIIGSSRIPILPIRPALSFRPATASRVSLEPPRKVFYVIK